MARREKETHLVFNPGPPRRKRKKISRRKNPSYNEDLIFRLEFMKQTLGNTKLNDFDRERARFYLGKISDLVVKNRA